MNLASLLTRRLLQAVPVLFGISIITFLLIYYLPADPARMYAGPSATVETVARIRHQLGLDLPIGEQYLRYMQRVLSGDLGFSYRKQIPVTALLLSRIPYTLALIFGGIFVELLIGLPVESTTVTSNHASCVPSTAVSVVVLEVSFSPATVPAAGHVGGATFA